MAGKPRKAPNALAGHRQKPGQITAKPAEPPMLAVVPASEPEPEPRAVKRNIPAFPVGLLKRSRGIWVRYWGSELSDHVDREGGLYRVERWIRDVDELERAWRLYRQARFVTGSMGQTRVNTVWRVIGDCEARIVKAEGELGMTPLARARLGLTLGEEANSLADLNKRMNEPDEPRGPRVVNPQDGAIEGEFTPL